MDTLAHKPHKEPNFVCKNFFRQLLQIFVVDIPESMHEMKEVDAEEETQGWEDEDMMHLSDGEALWGKDLV